jgi:hypothetical protein
MEGSMWMPHDRLCGVVRSIAVGSGLVASLAGATQIPAAMQEDALCTEVVESADGARHDKAALIYGLLLDDQQHSVASELAHKLALRDLRTAVPDGRLPGGPGGTRRPVAVVMCAKGLPEDDSAIRRAADHLITRVGVSAIVTFSTRQALVTQRAIAASGASVLHVCESCATELRRALEGIGDPSLVFQTSPPRASFASMILKKLPEFEAHVRERPGFDGSAQIRVALLRPHDDDGWWSFGRAIDDTLVINGSAAALQRGTNYLAVEYRTARTGGGSDRHETVAAAVAAFRPHIVMSIAGEREIVALLDTIERRLEPDGPRPIHWGWTPHGGLIAFIGTSDDRRRRVYSYAPGMPPTPEQRERLKAAATDFAREFPGAPLTLVWNHYGAPHQIMYAAAAAGADRSGRLTGADLARGIGATQNAGGRHVYVGRRDLAAGLADAAMGRPIALQNLQRGSPLNWSQHSSGIPILDNGQIYCFTRSPGTGALVETSAGQVWERRTNSLTGTFVPCP